ncbi:isochorismatase family protein [Planctomycetota bacterium]
MICYPMAHCKRPVLIDIDTQSHFFRPRGPMCIQNHRQVLTNIRKVMKWAQAKQISTFSTLQVHQSHAVFRQTRKGARLSTEKPRGTLHPKHICFASSDRMDWSADTWEHYDQVIIQKRTFDPFEEPRADRILTELSTQECILIGNPVEGAVKATALGLLLRQKRVTIVSDAIGCLDPILGASSWEHLHSKNIQFVSADHLVRTSPRTPLAAIH